MGKVIDDKKNFNVNNISSGANPVDVNSKIKRRVF